MSRFSKAQEEFAIEAFVPKLAIETLDVSVLQGLPGSKNTILTFSSLSQYVHVN
jgi:hypothetical protein